MRGAWLVHVVTCARSVAGSCSHVYEERGWFMWSRVRGAWLVHVVTCARSVAGSCSTAVEPYGFVGLKTCSSLYICMYVFWLV